MSNKNYNLDQNLINQIHDFFKARLNVGSNKENTYIPPKTKKK
jgi:hypothetical protein